MGRLSDPPAETQRDGSLLDHVRTHSRSHRVVQSVGCQSTPKLPEQVSKDQGQAIVDEAGLAGELFILAIVWKGGLTSLYFWSSHQLRDAERWGHNQPCSCLLASSPCLSIL